MHLWFAVQLSRFSRALEFIAIAFIPRKDLVHWNQMYFESLAKKRLVRNEAPLGLNEIEAFAVDKLRVGRAMVLGAGEGREAIALAKRGWEVIALEHSPFLLDQAKQNAAREAVSVEWISSDVLAAWDAPQPFDLICLFGQFYHYIPSKKWREQLLLQLKSSLAAEGKILISTPILSHPSAGRHRLHAIRLFLSKLFCANSHLEVGDHWSVTSEYYHAFDSYNEFAIEWQRGGFQLKTVSLDAEGELLLAYDAQARTSSEARKV